MATYRWLIEFALPGVPIARPVTLGAIQLTPAARDDNGDSRSLGCLTFDIDQCLDDSAVEKEALPKLETVAIAAAALGGSVREPVVTSVRLENRAALEAAGVLTPLENSGLLLTWNVLAADIDETALAAGYQAVLDLAGQDASLWPRAARWLWKANAEADPYDQFLALWIAFNVLYGPHKTTSEQGAVQAYLAQAIPTDVDAENLLAGVPSADLGSLGTSGLTLRGAGNHIRAIANELQAALGLPTKQQSRRELLTLAFLVVYAARCAIIHEGGVAVSRDKEIRLVWAGVRVLKAAIVHLLRRRLGV